MSNEHLDRALAEEFANHAETIHKLKVNHPPFRQLMELNHSMWNEIRNIQNGVTPASDTYLESLEKQRLRVLDDIAAMIATAEA